MNSTLPSEDRCLDLLTDQATQGLCAHERTELRSLLAIAGRDDDFSIDLAAAALDIARLTPADISPLPAPLAADLEVAGRLWAAERAIIAGRIGPGSQAALRSTGQSSSVQPQPRFATYLPWAAAACLAVSTFWAFRLAGQRQGEQRPATATAVATAPDVFKAEWAAWDSPEISNVKGYVHWSETLQRGVMHFSGLPKNDPSKLQYQLWIIDERGLAQRINGAIFDSTAQGELDVEIAPSIAVRNAAAFAVTIEQPGGTWVSDMSRRVVIAKKG